MPWCLYVEATSLDAKAMVDSEDHCYTSKKKVYHALCSKAQTFGSRLKVGKLVELLGCHALAGRQFSGRSKEFLDSLPAVDVAQLPDGGQSIGLG